MYRHYFNRIRIRIFFISIGQQSNLLQITPKTFINQFSFFIIRAFNPLLD
jgi:hypothetical protein